MRRSPSICCKVAVKGRKGAANWRKIDKKIVFISSCHRTYGKFYYMVNYLKNAKMCFEFERFSLAF